jgi:hypothetical protein
MPEDRDRRIGRRVRLARVESGYIDHEPRERLAQALRTPGLGARNIGHIERGERPLYEHEAIILGRVLNKPPGWFYEDPQPPPSELQQLAREVRELRALVETVFKTFPRAVRV